jgi:hypothetical protein
MLLEAVDSLFRQYGIVTTITYEFLQDERNDATTSICVLG